MASQDLGGFGIVRSVPRVYVDPAYSATDSEINEVIVADLVMVHVEAGIDSLPLLRLRIVHDLLFIALLERIKVTKLVRARCAKCGLFCGFARVHAHPHPPFPVDRYAARIGRTLPGVRTDVRRVRVLSAALILSWK